MNHQRHNLRNIVWIHLSGPRLVQGRIIKIFNLKELNEGHDLELYVIEVKTGIEDIYEIRTFDQISTTSEGPIAAFKDLDATLTNRMLNKVGMSLPYDNLDSLDIDDPTPEQIHAAIAKAEKESTYGPIDLHKPRRRNHNRKKKF